MKKEIRVRSEQAELERLNGKAERHGRAQRENMEAYHEAYAAAWGQQVQRMKLTAALWAMAMVLCCMVAVTCWMVAPWWTAVMPLINAICCLRKVLR